MALAAAFIFGLAVGSFLNVCIHRLPQGLSIVRPRSRCPHCQAQIRAYDNIPLLSFLLLRGRCRDCRAPISPVYPMVELLSGLVFGWAYAKFGLSLFALKFVALAALLIILIFTDFAERLLPDRVTFFGLGLGFLLSLFVPVADGTTATFARRWFDFSPPVRVASLLDAALGAAVGAGLLLLVREVYFLWRRVEGMGFGDVKLMAMVGSFLGVKLTLMTILLGSLLGSLIGGSYMLLTRKSAQYELPFGTFLGLGALLAAFWGTRFMGWYLGLLGG